MVHGPLDLHLNSRPCSARCTQRAQVFRVRLRTRVGEDSRRRCPGWCSSSLCSGHWMTGFGCACPPVNTATFHPPPTHSFAQAIVSYQAHRLIQSLQPTVVSFRALPQRTNKSIVRPLSSRADPVLSSSYPDLLARGMKGALSICRVQPNSFH